MDRNEERGRVVRANEEVRFGNSLATYGASQGGANRVSSLIGNETRDRICQHVHNGERRSIKFRVAASRERVDLSIFVIPN